MKKIISVLLIAVLACAAVVTLGGCSVSDELDVIASKVIENANLDAETKEWLNSDMISRLKFDKKVEGSNYYLGSHEYAYKFDYSEGYMLKPMINVSAFEVLVIRTADAKTAKEAATELEQNFDMMLWLCVTPEKLSVTTSGNIVFLVVGAAKTVDALIEAFNNVY